MDLVVISLERWDEVWRRNQHLVSGLVRADPALRVLFVEPPDDPLHAVRSGARPEFGHGLREVHDRLWTLRPAKWLPRRVDRGFDDRVATSVRRAASRLGMHDPVLWVNDPASSGIARASAWPVLYDLTDDWLSAERPAAESERVATGEKWLLAHADVVTACSAELVRRKAETRDDIVLIQNAVDTAAYRFPRERPHDLPSGATAVYLGTLHRDRLDVEVSVRTAHALAGRGLVVFVGPNLLDPDTTRLLQESGAILLGAKPKDDVIGYLQHADVLIVPHVVTPFTESLDPLKLYEYQAVGKPVVSTPVAGFRDAAGVTVADADAFPAAVAEALDASTSGEQDGPDRSGPGQAAPDWIARVELMGNALRRARGSRR